MCLRQDNGQRTADRGQAFNPQSAIHNPQLDQSAIRNPQFCQSAFRIRHSAIGFSLLETVVALAILSVGITVALQLFSGALKNVRKMDLAGQAMNYAENVMNELLSDETIKGPMVRHDDLDDNFRWEAFIEDFEIPEQSRWNAREVFPLKLLHVRVDVIYKNDKNGKLYRLNCLKPVGLRQQPSSVPAVGVPSPAGITPGVRPGNPTPRPFQ